MSGHSKWAQIKRQKGAADVKRGMTFTKIANAVALAVKLGGVADPNSNPRLREALESARKVNMPKDNIQRALDRGLGKIPGQIFEEVIYEGFGPEKVAYLLEGVTDNKLRTNQAVKSLFEHSGGALGGLGSTAYLFERVGEIKIKSKGKSLEEEILELIDLGAKDVEDFLEEGVQKYLIYTESTQLNVVSNKITQVGYEIEEAQTTLKPNTLIEIINKEKAEKVLDFTEKLEELDDIQKVYANFDIPDELMRSK